MPGTCFLLFTWPTSTHLSMSFSEEGFPCPPEQATMSWAQSRSTGMISPTRITCLLPASICVKVTGHHAARGRIKRTGSWPARRHAVGEWAAKQTDKVRANSNQGEKEPDRWARGQQSALESPGWQQVALNGPTFSSRAILGL